MRLRSRSCTPAALIGQTRKKFSTAARSIALASVFAPLVLFASSAAAARECAFLPNAPDQHLVVRGDTLWDISGKFLEHPWCWPQVWGLNRDQIRNPHWIYPGQIVYFDRAAGRLRRRPALPGLFGGWFVRWFEPPVRTKAKAPKK